MAVRLLVLRASLPPYTHRKILVLSSVRGRVNPRATVGMEGLGKLKNSVALRGIEPAAFRLVALCLNQVRDSMPRH
jgi:hypothetical protein